MQMIALCVAAASVTASLLDHLTATAGVIAPKIALADFDGLRGVAATEPIESGECILSIPVNLAFTDKELGLPSSIDSSARLAAALLVEDTESPRQAHLDSLQPATINTLAGRMPAAARELMSPELQSMAAAYGARDSDLSASLLAASRRKRKGKPKDPRMQALQKALDSSGDRDLKWALDITATRSYGLVLAGDGVGDSSSNGDSLSDLIESGELKLLQVICPILDYLNHQPDAKTRVSLRCEEATGEPSMIDVYAGKAYSIGEQLYLSYGPKCTNRLLASYGFVLPQDERNPHHYVTLRGALSSQRLAQVSEASSSTKLLEELTRWQRAEFRVYDSGRCGTVDTTIALVGRLAAQQAKLVEGGDGSAVDRSVALDLSKRAREQLEQCWPEDGDGGKLSGTEQLQAAITRWEALAGSDDLEEEGEREEAHAISLVLRCRLSDVMLWERFASGLEAFAAGKAGGASDLAEYLELGA